MLRSSLPFALTLALLPACGPSPEASPPPQPTSTAQADSPPPPPTADPSSSAQADAPPAPKADEPASESATLARDLLKGGGRRIGWSASKKAFAYPVEIRKQDGFSLDIQFLGDDGHPKDALRVCQMGECAEHLDEILAKGFLAKLASRLESDGYVNLRSIGWPQGKDELDVSSLNMKLRYSKGRLEGVRKGKPPVSFTPLGARPDADAIEAIFLVPDTKLVAVFAKPASNSKGVLQVLYVLKGP